MIDHLSLTVTDFDRAKRFYDAVMAALGYGQLMQMDLPEYVAMGYGPPAEPAAMPEPAFWIGAGKGSYAETRITPVPGHHIAFVAGKSAAVDAFHAAGLAHGGQDNGAPGLRPEYHAAYYAAFLIDPDGHHIEAVCHHGNA